MQPTKLLMGWDWLTGPGCKRSRRRRRSPPSGSLTARNQKEWTRPARSHFCCNASPRLKFASFSGPSLVSTVCGKVCRTGAAGFLPLMQKHSRCFAYWDFYFFFTSDNLRPSRCLGKLCPRSLWDVRWKVQCMKKRKKKHFFPPPWAQQLIPLVMSGIFNICFLFQVILINITLAVVNPAFSNISSTGAHHWGIGSLIVNQESNFLGNLTQNFRIVRVSSLFPGILLGQRKIKSLWLRSSLWQQDPQCNFSSVIGLKNRWKLFFFKNELINLMKSPELRSGPRLFQYLKCLMKSKNKMLNPTTVKICVNCSKTSVSYSKSQQKAQSGGWKMLRSRKEVFSFLKNVWKFYSDSSFQV